jgi:hypothetical protein
VAFVEGSDVEEGENFVVFVDYRGRSLLLHYLAENAYVAVQMLLSPCSHISRWFLGFMHH